MNDKDFMRIALEEAEKAYLNGELPIGAALVIGGNLIGGNSSSQVENANYFNHAENILIQRHGREIKKAHKRSLSIELYTTMEPCLMCLGAIVHNRITRIIYACPDPIAGSSQIDPPTGWYRRKWPNIEQGPLIEESYEIFMKHLEENQETWKNVLSTYRDLKEELL